MSWWEKWLHITVYVALTLLGLGAWALMFFIISYIGITIYEMV